MNSHRVSPEKNLNSGLFSRNTSNRSLLLVLFILAILFDSPAQSPEIKKAFRFIDVEQPSKGLSILEQFVTSNPTNSGYLYYLGLAHIRTGALDKALASFEKGISLNEKDGLNYAGKGHVRLLEKNPTDAKMQLDKALAISKSKDANVLKAVAEAYLTDTKYLLDALNLLNKAKAINANDGDIHLLLGDAQLMQNAQQGGEAVSSYERAAKADPKSGKPHYKIGKIFQRARSNDIAIASFEKATAADPDYAPAYKELGEIYYTQKAADKAVQAYEKYLAISENPGQAKFQYAFFLFMAKKYDKANAIFKEVTTNTNVSPVALRYYAYSLIEQGNTEEAKKIFEQYFQRAKPEEIQANDYAYYGKLLQKLAPPEDSMANEYFAKAIALDSLMPEIIQLHGDTFFKRKKYADAAQAYKQLMSIRKQPLSQDLYSIGRAYYYSGQYPQADSAFTQLAQKQPNMTVGYLFAARSKSQIDSTMKEGLAKPMYDALLERALQNPEKNKKEIIEAYEYNGAYYLQVKNDVLKSKEYFEKILAIDPNHAQAKEFMKELNKPAEQPKKGK